MTKIKIGLVSPEFPPDLGGVETYSYELTKELVRRNYDVTVYTRKHAANQLEPVGATIKPVLKVRRREDQPLLASEDIDIWHVTNAAYSWVALLKQPTVVSVHGNDFLRPYNLVERPDLARFAGLWRFKDQLLGLDKAIGRFFTNRLVKRTLHLADHIFTNSHYTDKVLLEHYPLCKGKTTVAMVGVGDEFLEMDLDKKPVNPLPRLVSICRLSEPRKNIDIVLKALAKLKLQGYAFEYTVVGEGALRTQLEQLSTQLGLENDVKFTGAVPFQTLKDALISSDLFILASGILPTSHEGFGIVYVEAAACGTPVLAARLAGAVDAVKDGVSGYFVDQATEASLTEAIKQFLDKKVVFSPKECREFADQYRWKYIVDRIIPIYENAIASYTERK